jgi:hypothetical protein
MIWDIGLQPQHEAILWQYDGRAQSMQRVQGLCVLMAEVTPSISLKLGLHKTARDAAENYALGLGGAP